MNATIVPLPAVRKRSLSCWLRRLMGWATWSDLTVHERQMVAHLHVANPTRRLG